jgi:hypothetical protein
MGKKYDILELQKMSIVELTSICDQSSIEIQNNFKQGLIYAILDRQTETPDKSSELHARNRYAFAEKITKGMAILLMILLSVNLNAEASLKYKLRRHFNRIEQQDQHQNWMPACKDHYRYERNLERWPSSYKILPQLKLFKRWRRR